MTSLNPRPNHPLEVLKSLISIKSWHALRTHFLAQQDWEKSRRSKESISFENFVPWWSYSAIGFIDQVIPTTSSILELGSGYSTLWWLKRGNSVVAIESNQNWASKISDKGKIYGNNLQMIVESPSNVNVVGQQLDKRKFDVIVIDHSGDRTSAVTDYLPVLSETGFVIFDNSDRSEYADGLRLLREAGFSRLDFFGLGPINAYASQTSFFYRGSFDGTLGREQQFGIIDY